VERPAIVIYEHAAPFTPSAHRVHGRWTRSGARGKTPGRPAKDRRAVRRTRRGA